MSQSRPFNKYAPLGDIEKCFLMFMITSHKNGENINIFAFDYNVNFKKNSQVSK